MRRASVSMEQVRDTISNKQKLVIAINVLVSCFIFAVVITSISAASDAGSSRAAGAAGFVGVWNMLMILGVNVGTFWVLKKRPTVELVSYMTGITHIFTLNSLSLAVLFGGLNRVESHASFRAYSAFSVLLMFCYGAMSFILVRFRDEIVDDKSGPQQSHPDGTFEPPAAMADEPASAPAPSHEGPSDDYAPPGNSA